MLYSNKNRIIDVPKEEHLKIQINGIRPTSESIIYFARKTKNLANVNAILET